MNIVLTVITAMLSLTGCIGAGRNSDVVATPPDVASLPSLASFPTVVGIDLLGRERSVPKDLPGSTRLVIAAYEREQQSDVDTWIAQLPAIRKRIPDVTFCELPVIAKGNPLFRAWVNNGMRSGIRDDQRRAEVITVYTDVQRFLEATDQRDTSGIAVFLLDNDAFILARTRGRFSTEKFEALVKSAQTP